jgi:hypothetical protein
MFKRIGIAFLWFLAFVLAGEIAWSFAGAPRAVAVAAGGLAVAFTWVDPLRLTAARRSNIAPRLTGDTHVSQLAARA